jgi:hypothetical protein
LSVIATYGYNVDTTALLQVVKVAGVGLYALFREKKEKPRN